MPAEDPLAAALRMRASDADRERVAGVLRESYAEGRLSPAEHEERLAEVYRATTYGELLPTLTDLPVPPGTLELPGTPQSPVSWSAAVPAATGAGALVVDPGRAGSGEARLVAVFSGFDRKGHFVLAPKVNATCIFGGGTIDLSHAVLTARETEIQAVCIFGGVEITVPSGVAVRLEVTGVFGGSDGPRDEALPPNAPVLRVTGAAIFGGVSIKRAKP